MVLQLCGRVCRRLSLKTPFVPIGVFCCLAVSCRSQPYTKGIPTLKQKEIRPIMQSNKKRFMPFNLQMIP
jgi:hypothetical protein